MPDSAYHTAMFSDPVLVLKTGGVEPAESSSDICECPYRHAATGGLKLEPRSNCCGADGGISITTMLYKKPHLAIYGSIVIKRAYCEECKTFAFVFKEELACCGRRYEEKAEKIKRMAAPDGSRHLSKKAKREILKQQDYMCAYCWRTFGSYVKRGEKLIKLRYEFDHIVPFNYVRDTKEHNIVAACHVCNGLKSDLIFQTMEDAQIFLLDKRAEKGYNF